MSVRVEHGDCREVVRALADASIDACVTDPPYSLVSIQKRFGKPGSAPAKEGKDGLYRRASQGFMGQQWDTGETAFDPDWWREVYRVLKPGAHLVAFSGTRTYHRMACAIEDAGFEIRDQIAWTYGSGFPKSHNIGGGWGTALKPAWEPICLARKSIMGTVAANVAAHGTGALNIEACRVETTDSLDGGTYTGELRDPGPQRCLENRNRKRGIGEYVQPAGRWPANLVHDGSDEVLEAFAQFGERTSGTWDGKRTSAKFSGVYNPLQGTHEKRKHGDSGSAARFFFSGKADADDRIGSKHPTVKPVALMRWLVRLVTPPGGLVLDPFAGTGTTGVACIREGTRAVLIEREDQYVADIKRRLAMLSGFDTPLLAGAAE